ncbi:phage integrase N-terminal SAM-like domain-containing protein [Nitratifractor sp.]|uniref:phage integrase N-terminal SAM-like domain-containing protein n=1 Tax=Nitratifractor sp. TaxID=2268144 RepID=UPI0025DF782E|nr:phage integrase N-terminal SAM-like domain-containing protein [Nitratifractor sp.]
MYPRKKKLLNQVRNKIRLKHYSLKTERSYIGGIKRYIIYHNKRHPLTMGKKEIESFLSWLAADLPKQPLHIVYSVPPSL